MAATSQQKTEDSVGFQDRQRVHEWEAGLAFMEHLSYAGTVFGAT